MFNQFYKVGAALVISSFSLAFSPLQSVQAQEIKEAFYGFNFEVGSGLVNILYNDQGILSSSAFFSEVSLVPPVAFPEPESIVLSGEVSYNLEPVSDFYYLVGVYGGAEGSYTFADGRSCDEFGGCSFGNGTLYLSLNGNQYTAGVTQTSQNYNIFGELISEDTFSGIFYQGTISFDQIQPLPVAIPEPLTLLGVATAVSFGTYFKKKISQKNKFNK